MSNSRTAIQKIGRFLSGMVMPNIGAFIAWGLITTLFIETGWLPNGKLVSMVGPMINYLLPLLIAYTGGKLVGGQRGAVVGAIAAMGVIVGAGIPMFIGAMIMGPLGGLAIKQFDKAVEGRVKAGFEMLINNFSAGLIGMGLAVLGYYLIGPVVLRFTEILGSGVESIVVNGLLPVASIFIEPAKILFLNNAINHGVLSPLGIAEAADVGKSIFFLLETNPGPGLGILLAYAVFGKGMAKSSAPASIIIHFFGGIHEIYFPYVLMKPSLILAVIAGGASGVATFGILGAGLVATPSPGSIFALAAMAPRGSLLPVLAGVSVATVVSFLVASVFVRRGLEDEAEFEDAKENMVAMKGKESSVVKIKANVKKIVVACDAGMGSSAMGATKMRKLVKEKGLSIAVFNTSLEDIPQDADIVITHSKLTARAKSAAPHADHYSLDNYVQTNVYSEIAASLKGETLDEAVQAEEAEVQVPVQEVTIDTEILSKKNIHLGLASETKTQAIERAGKLLVQSGYVQEPYIAAMHEREEVVTTYIGNHVAIPHGVGKAKDYIDYSGFVVLQYPDGVNFGDGNIAYLVIGIAGKGNEHISILSNIARALDDEEGVLALAKTSDVQEIYSVFTDEVKA